MFQTLNGLESILEPHTRKRMWYNVVMKGNVILGICVIVFGGLGCGWECDKVARPVGKTAQGVYKEVRITLDAETEDVVHTHTPDDVAKRVWATKEAAKNLDLESIDEIVAYLSSGHLYQTGTPQTFYDIWHADLFIVLPKTPEEFADTVAGYVHAEPSCTFDTDGNWLIVVGPGRAVGDLVYHELAHVISLLEYGHTDYDHENRELFGQLAKDADLIYNMVL